MNYCFLFAFGAFVFWSAFGAFVLLFAFGAFIGLFSPFLDFGAFVFLDFEGGIVSTVEGDVEGNLVGNLLGSDEVEGDEEGNLVGILLGIDEGAGQESLVNTLTAEEKPSGAFDAETVTILPSLEIDTGLPDMANVFGPLIWRDLYGINKIIKFSKG